jgi:hypothetical protein
MDEFLLAVGNGDNINPSTRPVSNFFRSTTGTAHHANRKKVLTRPEYDRTAYEPRDE